MDRVAADTGRLESFMKKVLVWLGIGVMPVAAFAFGQQTAPTVSGPVAFVSAQRISSETQGGKAGQSRMQALQRERTAEIQAQQKALEELRAAISKEKVPAELARLRGEEQQKRRELERAAARMQADMQALQREISADLTVKVRVALNEILKGSSVRIVLNSETAVVWSAPGLDLTPAVIEHMNATAAPAGQP